MNSKIEAQCEGMSLPEEREERLATLDVAIERGRADVKAGRLKPVEEVFKRLKAKYTKMAESRT